jgi:RNA-dependent RNA polymerase
MHSNVDITKFKSYCKKADFSDKQLIDLSNHPAFNLQAANHGLFDSKRVRKLKASFKIVGEEDRYWPVAFQLEALLHNCLLHSSELEELIPSVKEVCKEHGSEYVAELLRNYGEQLQTRQPIESAAGCFTRVRSEFVSSPLSLSPGHFLCHHVTFAPTRLILEGPNPMQSNRIIRRYSGYEVRRS